MGSLSRSTARDSDSARPSPAPVSFASLRDMGKSRHFLLFAVVLTLAVSATLGAASRSESDDFFWELQSDDPDLLGPSTCPLHHVGTVYEEVPVQQGMCTRQEEYKRAKLLRFPYSYFTASSCACDMAFGPVPRLYCPICRRNELRWRLANGWSIQRETGSKEKGRAGAGLEQSQ